MSVGVGDQIRGVYEALRADLVRFDRLEDEGASDAAIDLFFSGLSSSRSKALGLAFLSMQQHRSTEERASKHQAFLSNLSGPAIVSESQGVTFLLRGSFWWMLPDMLRRLFDGRSVAQFLAASELLHIAVVIHWLPWELAALAVREVALLVDLDAREKRQGCACQK